MRPLFYAQKLSLNLPVIGTFTKVFYLLFLSFSHDSQISVGEKDWRKAQLIFLFSRNILMIQQKDPSVLKCGYDRSDPNHPKLICFFMCAHSQYSASSFFEKVAAGLLWIPFSAGLSATSRLLSVAEFGETIIGAIMGGRPHIELQRMVVHPDYQGKRIGSTLLGLFTCSIHLSLACVD
jgi:GNAT superfamily N-acetyltransferase